MGKPLDPQTQNIFIWTVFSEKRELPANLTGFVITKDMEVLV